MFSSRARRLLALAAAALLAAPAAAEKPKVRTVTASIKLDRARAHAQVQEALTFLRSAAALRGIAVKHAGYSSLMLPVLEDSVLARRWSEGTLTLDSLLSYSAVCGTGLDVVPLPGDVSEQHFARIIADVASMAVKLRKPLSVRLLPVAGKKAGQVTEFADPYLVHAVIQSLP